jgi:hypothetical protein
MHVIDESADYGRVTGHTEVVAAGLWAAGAPEIPDREPDLLG